MKEQWITIDEIAQELRVRRQTVWNWVRKGYLPASKFGKLYRVTNEDYQAFLARNRITAK